MAMAADLSPAQIKRPTAMKAYLMEAGKVPYKWTAGATTGGILATEVQMPGFGMMGVGDISFDKIKDTSRGENTWTYLWDVDSMSYPVQAENLVGATTAASSGTAGTASYGYKLTSVLDATKTMTGSYDSMNNGLLYGVAAFTISNFVVREITIRDYTVAECWAAIGGLWSGSLMICMIFFSTTEIVDAKHRLFRVFNFTCPAQRDEWLANADAEAIAAGRNAEQKEAFVAMYKSCLANGDFDVVQGLGVLSRSNLDK